MNQNLPEPNQKKWIPDGFHFLGPEDSKYRRTLLETISGVLKKKDTRKYFYLHSIIALLSFKRFRPRIHLPFSESEIFPEMKFLPASI
ncbi:hypothetical protein LEP1GSC148_4195 [Leptospira interrogans serovar Canicola str. LT1962]|nr:hypothetical protein LEP1GSC148_4195 [Leptospira interrogans serovar Canicola str. LT1962]EMN71648.1 hypothetical protein LEP1GSC100_4925 [Leptospira interrogans serovar Bataviae str. UI 08561]